MRNCTHCGAPVGEKTVVCVKCGYIQNHPAAQAAAPVSLAQRVSAVPAVSKAPAVQLKTDRSLLKFILLSILTFGIYGIVVMSSISRDINTIASRYDFRRTMHYCWVYFLFSWLTLGIVPLVWGHRLCGRIGRELLRRRISYKFGAGTFWGWGIFGSLILIGPLVYTHKLLKAMNILAENYNFRG